MPTLYKFIFLSFGAIFLSSLTLAQSYRPYSWVENRKLYITSDADDESALYFIEKNEIYQFIYDSLSGDLICYVTQHNILKVNNDEAIQKSNKVYIPMRNTLELIDVQARVITKKGNVKTFDDSNLKELESEDSGYKILAVEGAETESEIEYFFTRKVQASNFISNNIQTEFPIHSYTFTLSSPENLEYDFKLYNDDNQVQQTDSSESYNQYDIILKNVPELLEEEFSAYDNSKIRLEVKLAYNSNSSSGRLFTWGDAGKRIYGLTSELNSNEKKAFSKFINGLDLSGEPLAAFKKTEHFIKTNFYFEENAGPDGENLDAVIKNKYGTSRGFTKLYVALLNHLQIEHEVVLSTDRFTKVFDPEFDTWNYLGEYLIYIVPTNQFMSPKDTPFRLGTIPQEHIGNYGLFIKPELIQSYEYPVSRIGFIPAPSYEKNQDDMEVNVTFNPTLESNNVIYQRSFNGYGGEYYKAAMLFSQGEQKKELIDDVLKFIAQDAQIKSSEVVGLNAEFDTWQKPFTVSGDFDTNSYIESAGSTILFKAGDLIGPQSELYQENERLTEVVNSFNRGYSRRIKITIPDDYEVRNAEDLVINKVIKEGDEPIFKFDSNYELNGNILSISIEEFYNKLYYPKDEFEAFREVINAAADFNKVVLVLSK